MLHDREQHGGDGTEIVAPFRTDHVQGLERIEGQQGMQGGTDSKRAQDGGDRRLSPAQVAGGRGSPETRRRRGGYEVNCGLLDRS